EIPGNPIVYWATDQIMKVFENGERLEEIASPRQGLATGNNNEFLRLWFEINNELMGTNIKKTEDFHKSGYRYAPYNKGGSFRKWYGNFEYVIKFDRENFEMLSQRGNHLPSRKFYFLNSITWSFVSSRYFGVRYSPTGSVFDVGGSSVFPPENLKFYLTGLLTSKVSTLFMNMFNPTLNFQVGDIKKVPVIKSMKWKKIVVENVKENIRL